MKIKAGIILSFILLCLSAVNVSAASSTWTSYPVFGSGTKKIIETDKLVYFLNSGLFVYDKENREQRPLTTESGLASSVISNIYYNRERDVLFVAYDKGNIDLIYGDGRIVNMPELTLYTGSETQINDVIFDGKVIYVATNYGIIKFDIDKAEVIESGVYNKRVYGLSIVNGHLVAHIEFYIHFLDLNKSIRQYDNFVNTGCYCVFMNEFYPLDDNTIIGRGDYSSYYALRRFKLNFETNRVTENTVLATCPTIQPFIHFNDNVYVVLNDVVKKFDENNNMVDIYTLPDEYKGDVIDACSSIENIWTISNQGVSNIEVSDGGNALTVLIDRFNPYATYTKDAWYIVPAGNTKELYTMNIGMSSSRRAPRNNFAALALTRMNYSLDKFTSYNPYPVEGMSPTMRNLQKTYGNYVLAPSMIAVDNEDYETVYVGTNYDGIYKIKNGNLIGIYSVDRTPMKELNGYGAFGVHIDKGGNLWMIGYGLGSDDYRGIYILPADKKKLDPADVTADDWIIPPYYDYAGAHDVVILECKKSNMIFITSHGTNVLFAIDTNGTPNDFNDDKCYLHTNLVDQDGKSYTLGRKTALVEDKNGRVWFGSEQGVFIINPAKATDPDMTVTHVKVPRNDGTNEADYLLGSDIIYSIAVDNSNTKWIATDKSGLYHVSENGSEILEIFNADNSPLPKGESNVVYALPDSPDLFVGTPAGFFHYSYPTEVIREDFDNIVAYPNPVRPDYTGPVYIKGLMENTLVKIADASGNVVAQGRAENGVYQWNVCNSNGMKVKTGVYFVMVSQNANGNGTGAVKKIMVIN